MTNNAFLCGWYDVAPTLHDVEVLRPAMLSRFSVSKSKWFTNKYLNIASTGDVASISSKIDVAIIGAPYWKRPELEKKSTEYGYAQVIATIYLECGMRFLDSLAGRFSIVLFDHQREELVLCLDRMGQQHLYYTQTSSGVIFSSRADAVVSHPSVDKIISNQGIYDYFYFHAIPSSGSIYKNVSKLENGQYVAFRNGSIVPHYYWKPEFVEQNHESIESLSEEMLSIIERSVSRCVARPEYSSSVGAFLSGGLDSSTVSGALSKITNGKAQTFSIGFDAEGYDEMEYARIASKHFNTGHNEYYVTPDDVIAEVPNISRYLDEPFGNSSALPAYFCAKMAKERGVKILLAGDGGDELFAGNERYAKQEVFESYYNIPAIFRGLFLEPLFLHNPIMKHMPVLNKIYSYIRQAKIPLPDRLETYNYLHRHAAEEIFSREVLASVDQQHPLNILRESYQYLHNVTDLNRMMWPDWKRTLHDNDLVKVNRMCERVGVGVAYPLLDDELVDFSCRIPSDIKLKNGTLRWFYKEAVAGFLPQEIIEKKKQGFGLPFGIWTSEHVGLQELAYASLESLNKRELFSKSFIDQTITMHQSVHAKFYGELVWILMMLELWLSSR